jgi:hypothetical protein
MSYVDRNLMTGEKVVYRTRPHWILFLGPRYGRSSNYVLRG